jgi:SRSO17 transposase
VSLSYVLGVQSTLGVWPPGENSQKAEAITPVSERRAVG